MHISQPDSSQPGTFSVALPVSYVQKTVMVSPSLTCVAYTWEAYLNTSQLREVLLVEVEVRVLEDQLLAAVLSNDVDSLGPPERVHVRSGRIDCHLATERSSDG